MTAPRMEDMEMIGSLYDGGWRAKDRDALIEEYGLTDEEADRIVDGLAWMAEHQEA